MAAQITRKQGLVTLFLDQRRHALARIAAGDVIAEVLDELIYAVEDTANKQSEAAQRNHIDRLKTFNQLSKSIYTDLDLERLVQTVTDIATELSGAKFGAFFYNNRKSTRLNSSHSSISYAVF